MWQDEKRLTISGSRGILHFRKETTVEKAMAFTPCRRKWKSTMTDRRRFIDQMHYKPVDRCFNMEFGYWEENFRKWSVFSDNGITDDDQADIFFNFDKMGRDMGMRKETRIWMQPPFEETVVEETTTTKIIITEDGLLAEVPRDGHETIPRYIRSSIATPEDWARCKALRFRPDDPVRKIDVRAMKEANPPDRDYPLGVYCGSMIGYIRGMLTLEGLAYACHDHPVMVEDMVETACVLVENYLDQVLPHIEFDFAHSWEDICCKNGPVVSVDFFKNAVVPRYKRIRNKLGDAGIDIWYADCDGDVRPLLPHFLEGGINCLMPYEVNSCGPLEEVLKEFGRELRIMGGVDKIEMAKGPGAIRAFLESLVPLVDRGGYIPFCDHLCPPDVTVDNYLHYLDIKEEIFGLKKIIPSTARSIEKTVSH